MLQERLQKQLNDSEKVLFIIREYSIAYVWQMLIVGLLYFGWLFLLYPLLRSGAIGTIVFVAGLLCITGWTVRAFVVWYLDVVIVTDERLIDIDQSGLFRKSVRTIAWATIRDVQYQQSGVWSTLWNYATITAVLHNGELIELYHVAQPKQLTEQLLQYAKANQSKSTVTRSIRDS